MQLRILLLLFVMLLTSCIPVPGDIIVRGAGEVVRSGQPEATCLASLPRAQGQGKPLEETSVFGQFAVNFMVPTKFRRYVVELSCNELS